MLNLFLAIGMSLAVLFSILAAHQRGVIDGLKEARTLCQTQGETITNQNQVLQRQQSVLVRQDDALTKAQEALHEQRDLIVTIERQRDEALTLLRAR